MELTELFLSLEVETKIIQTNEQIAKIALRIEQSKLPETFNFRKAFATCRRKDHGRLQATAEFVAPLQLLVDLGRIEVITGPQTVVMAGRGKPSQTYRRRSKE